MEKVTAEMLLKRFNMSQHIENGSYLEVHYPSDKPGRPESGSIYYYVSPEEISKFHYIDCDEYWCYVAGSPLEICAIEPDGSITSTMLGIDEGCVPKVYFKSGVKFASRHPKLEQEGTFLICITVPRFDPDGFTMIENEDIIKEYPSLKDFFNLPYIDS